LCITINGAPLLTTLHDGISFAVAQHTEVATQLSALWAAVSLAAQSILRHLAIDVPQAGVVGEMVVRFWEQASWCSCLRAAGREICDLVLILVGDQTCLVTCLEEAARQLRMMRGEQGGLKGLASGLVT
jgi:hypothetical protein